MLGFAWNIFMVISVYIRLKDWDETKSTWKGVACKGIIDIEVFYKKHPMEVIIYDLYSIYFMCLILHIYFYYFQATLTYDS